MHHTAPLRNTQEWLVPSARDESAGALITDGVDVVADIAGDVATNSPQRDATAIKKDLKCLRGYMASR